LTTKPIRFANRTAFLLRAANSGLKIAVPARRQQLKSPGADELRQQDFNYKDNFKTARGFWKDPKILLT
jgi:hypothetical protein